MSKCVQVFVVPRGTHNRIIVRFDSYRQGDDFLPFGKHGTAELPAGGRFGQRMWVTTPLRWIEIVEEYKNEWNIEYGDMSDGPMYEDACVQWLQKQFDLDLYEIVFTEGA